MWCDTFLIPELIWSIIKKIIIKPLIVGLAIFLCASFEVEFNLSENVKAKISMEGRKLMKMIACMKIVAVGVSGVCPC